MLPHSTVDHITETSRIPNYVTLKNLELVQSENQPKLICCQREVVILSDLSLAPPGRLRLDKPNVTIFFSFDKPVRKSQSYFPLNQERTTPSPK